MCESTRKLHTTKVSRKKNRTEEMMGKELAQIHLDQNNNILLTKILFDKLVKKKVSATLHWLNY